MCFSFELSLFFCFGMSFSDHCGAPHCSRGGAGPLLFSHSFPRKGELRKRWFFAIRQADWSNFRVPNSTVWCIEHFLPKKKFVFMFVPESLWTLPGSITICLKPRKAELFLKAGSVPSAFSFRPPISPKWECEARRHIERKCDVCPAVVLGTNYDVTHYRKLAESEGKRFQPRRSLCKEAFCVFRLHLEEHRVCTRSVYARWRLRDTWRSRSSDFLNGNRVYPLFLFK